MRRLAHSALHTDTRPLFILDDQAHYLANEIRANTAEVERVIRTLKESYSLLSIDTHSEEGFLNHFFTETATHVACLNLFGLSEICGIDVYRSIEIFARTRDRAPNRVVLFGFVNPLEGEKALERMDHQFHDLNAAAFKFYPMDPSGGPEGWWCDDPKIAYPVWEKMQSLGIKFTSIHKLPLPMIANRWQDPMDIDAAAASFPKINFVIYHMGYPEVEKVATICANRPNVYADFGSPLIPAIVYKPAWFTDQLCKFLAVAPVRKICWGSDTMIAPGGQEYIEAFWDWQIPEHYQKGYGIPPLTDEDKKMVLGRTMASFLGIDPESRLHGIEGDEYSKRLGGRVREFLSRANNGLSSA